MTRDFIDEYHELIIAGVVVTAAAVLTVATKGVAAPLLYQGAKKVQDKLGGLISQAKTTGGGLIQDAPARLTPSVQRANQIVMQNAARGQLMTPAQAAKIIPHATRVGSALKNDSLHRAGAFLTESQLARGTTQFLTGQNDGVTTRTLLKVEGMVNNLRGVFEFIIEPSGVVSHELFKPFR